MSKKMATVVMCYGLLLAGFAYLISSKADELGQVVINLCFAVGTIFVVFGLAAWAGYKRRHWLVISQIAVVVVLLKKTLDVGLFQHAGTEWGYTKMSFSIVLLLSFGMLMYLFHGERSPEFYRKAPHNEPLPREGHAGSTSSKPSI